MVILSIALKSTWNRRKVILASLISIAVSVALLLAIDQIRSSVRNNFSGAVAGIDMVVGARSSNLQLLLSSVFRIGEVSNNVTWATLAEIEARPEVSWLVPIALGDSHRGYRVVGTATGYFDHMRDRNGQVLDFVQGGVFERADGAVLGSTVARQLGYAVGDEIVINHGLGSEALAPHDQMPFTVAGILRPTGTPIDQAVHVPLSGLDLMHGHAIAGELPEVDMPSQSVTAMFIGVRSPIELLTLQRDVSQYSQEALTALIPGYALLELWTITELAEQALWVVSILVAIVAFVGMTSTLLALLTQRSRELAILRAAGAGSLHIGGLILTETLFVALGGLALGSLVFLGAFVAVRQMVEATSGVYVGPLALGTGSLAVMAIMIGLAIVSGTVTAISALRQSIAAGITPME